MNSYLQSFHTRADRFTELVAAVPDEAWANQSPCTDWTAGEVVGHVVETQRDFLLRHDLCSETPPSGPPATLWTAHLDDLTTRLGDGAVLDTEYDGFFGRTTIGATLADFYGFDMVVHRWDLARAVDRSTDFTEAEMDLLDASITQFGDAMYTAGICEPALPVAEGASRQERLLASMGRAA